MTRRVIRAALRHLDPDCPYEDWFRVSAIIFNALDGDGLDLFDDWSAHGSKYPGRARVERHWRYLKPMPQGRALGIGTLRRMVQASGVEWSTVIADAAVDDAR